MPRRLGKKLGLKVGDIVTTCGPRIVSEDFIIKGNEYPKYCNDGKCDERCKTRYIITKIYIDVGNNNIISRYHADLSGPLIPVGNKQWSLTWLNKIEIKVEPINTNRFSILE